MVRLVWHVAALSAVLLACGVALGVIGVFFFAQPSVPPALASAQQPAEVSVTPQEYADPQDVTVSVSQGSVVPLQVGRGGVLTSVSCSESEVWHSGSSNASVDGSPVINLHSTVPLWREVTVGLKGSDVSALKAELQRLGFSVTAGDAFGRGDLAAVRELFSRIQAPATFGSVSPSQFVWLPSGDVAAGNCALLGSRLEAGDTIAEVSPAVSLQLQDVPPTLRTGLRDLIIDQVRIPLSEDLTPQDPAGLAAVLQAPSYRSAIGEEGATTQPVTLSATVALVEPIQAVPLPPSAITITSAPEGCVMTPDGKLHPVTIVSSELGRTVVVFNGPELPDEVTVSGPKQCG